MWQILLDHSCVDLALCLFGAHSCTQCVTHCVQCWMEQDEAKKHPAGAVLADGDSVTSACRAASCCGCLSGSGAVHPYGKGL